MRVSRAHCEGLEVETDCFFGCGFGIRTGGVYRFLPPEVPSSKFTRNRCRLSDHPRCACSPDSSPPPAFYSPPPPVAYDQAWAVFFPDFKTDNTIDTRYGTLGVLHKRILNGRTLDLSLREGPMHAFDCPARDDGADTCGAICAKHHLSRLRAYTVTGEHYNSPPPPPPPPTQPPFSPPPFVQKNTSEPFNGCQTSCAFSDKNTLCRDGGKGSFSPAICSYATMCTLCGPRPRVGSTYQEMEGDDACAYAKDGVCQDGGADSEFIRIDSETSTHLCGFATDTTDCGARTVSTIDSSAFNFNPTPPLPRPPPPPPPSPPVPPPPISECGYSCPWEGRAYRDVEGTEKLFRHCSDGGINSIPSGFDDITGSPTFGCIYGQQCGDCSSRTADVSDLCSDSCRGDVISSYIRFTGRAINGICEDGGEREAFTLIEGEDTLGEEGADNYRPYYLSTGCGYGESTLPFLQFLVCK